MQNRANAYRGNGSPATSSPIGEAYNMNLQDHLIEDYSQRAGGHGNYMPTVPTNRQRNAKQDSMSTDGQAYHQHHSLR